MRFSTGQTVAEEKQNNDISSEVVGLAHELLKEFDEQEDLFDRLWVRGAYDENGEESVTVSIYNTEKVKAFIREAVYRTWQEFCNK